MAEFTGVVLYMRSFISILLILVLGLLQGPESLYGQVVINEFLADNALTNFDDDGDNEDWVELYNSGDEDIDLEGYSLSDDVENPGRWTFPSVMIPARSYLLVWLSGKDRHVPPPDAIEANGATMAFEPVFVRRGAQWDYLVADPDADGPPEGWNLPGQPFPGSSRDTAGFGYGDGDDSTDVPENSNAVFTRREFEVPNPAAVTNLVLSIDFDDGFIAFINGVRLAESNAPDGEVTFSIEGTGKHEAGTAETFDLSAGVESLVEGTNVISVVGLNTLDPTSSDMSLHAELGIVPNVLHANFSLEREGGEAILLSNPQGELVSGIAYPEQTQDHSYGMHSDSDGEWHYLLTPTPGAANTTRAFDSPISTNVSLAPPPGFYSGSQDVAMSAEPSDLLEIYYTTNGSEPTTRSTRYTTPVRITRNTVFRIAGFINGGERATAVQSSSYFIPGRSFTGSTIDLPVLSISMPADDFNTVQTNTGARGRGSEREAYWEYFDEDGELRISTGFGLRLHGGAGRGGGFSTKKAYKAYFRGVYGDTKMRYPDFMPESDLEEFDKFVLRSSFNDAIGRNGNGSLLRDQLIRDLHRDMGAPASHGTWCNLYVNMAYRGVYNIVERMDEEFMEAYFPDEGDDWDVIKTGNDVLVGDNREWNRLGDFMDDNNLSSNAVYDQFAEMVDIENYTSYMIVNMWAQNHDWPHNNWYASRPRIEGGKWRFFCWDAEFGISLSPGGYTSDTFSFVFGRNGQLADIIDALVDNVGYRRYFVTQVENALGGPLSSANSRGRLNDLRAVILPDIADELDLVDRSRSNWDRNVSTMNTFLSNRNGPFLNHINNSSRLDFPPDQTPILRSVTPDEIVNTGGVEVRIRGVRLNRDTRIFFNDVEAEVLDYLGLIGGLNVRVPFDGSLSGPVSVRARNDDADVEVEEEGLFTILLPAPVVTGLQPDTGSAEGGETVFLSGGNFLEGVTVFFGDQEAPSVTRFGPKNDSTVLLQVTTPPGQGPVEVRAVNTQPGRAESVDSVTFTYRSPVGYIRGDPDSSGDVNLTDAVLLLNYLFSGGTEPGCPAAADTDRNGEVDMSDAIRILNYLFVGGAELLAPFPECGQDPLGEMLSCPAASNCQ